MMSEDKSEQERSAATDYFSNLALSLLSHKDSQKFRVTLWPLSGTLALARCLLDGRDKKEQATTMTTKN